MTISSVEEANEVRGHLQEMFCEALIDTGIGECALSLLRALLAHFPKMKAGLSNHQSVSLSPINNI
jgi:hypothetical protein